MAYAFSSGLELQTFHCCHYEFPSFCIFEDFHIVVCFYFPFFLLNLLLFLFCSQFPPLYCSTESEQITSPSPYTDISQVAQTYTACIVKENKKYDPT